MMHSANSPSPDGDGPSGIVGRRATDCRVGDLADVLSILRANWLAMAVVWGGVMALAVASLALRVYTGVASILIDAGNRVPVGNPAAGQPQRLKSGSG